MLPNNFHVDRSVLQDGKLIMSDPVLTGQNGTGGVYRVTAQRAIQSLSNPNDVRLENIKGSFPLSGGKVARLEAEEREPRPFGQRDRLRRAVQRADVRAA